MSIWGDEAGAKDWAGEGKREKEPGMRVVHEPTASGPGDGTAFFFLFGLNRGRSIDQEMVKRECAAIEDDIATLRAAGFTVVVDRRAVKDDLVAALAGEAEQPAAGIYWSAHGHKDGSIEASDGGRIKPGDLESVQVTESLRLFVMSACYSASRARTWRRALGGDLLVVGWGRPVTISRAVDFLTPSDDIDTDLDDLIRRYLIEGEPLPEDLDAVGDRAAHLTGQTTPISELVGPLCELIDARQIEREGGVEIRVPTASGRFQSVRLCASLSSQPLFEGQLLFAAESEVGELAGVLKLADVLRGGSKPGLARVVLVEGQADLPVVWIQGFLPLHGSKLHALAGLTLEVAHRADALERQIFGGDVG